MAMLYTGRPIPAGRHLISLYHMNNKVDHPWIAFMVIVIVAAIMSNYGIVHGSLMLFDLFAGVAVYKWITASQG